VRLRSAHAAAAGKLRKRGRRTQVQHLALHLGSSVRGAIAARFDTAGMDRTSGSGTVSMWVTGRASGAPRLTQVKARGGIRAHADAAVGHGRHHHPGSPMQFHVQLDTGRIDLASLEQQLQTQDPSALADFDALTRTLRLSTTLAEGDIVASLARSGIAVPEQAIERQASTCCGGCGG
jgi:hypothetical protein